jgi:hypothetical protein
LQVTIGHEIRVTQQGWDEIVQLMTDESDVYLASLLGELSENGPDTSIDRERILVLPRNLGDLEKPECIAEMKEKIEKLKLLKQMLNSGLISWVEYESLKTEISNADVNVSKK